MNAIRLRPLSKQFQILMRGSLRLMHSRAAIVRKRLVEKLDADETMLVVREEGGGCEGGTLNVSIVSPRFRGMTRVQMHRMVNEHIADQHFHAINVVAKAKE